MKEKARFSPYRILKYVLLAATLAVIVWFIVSFMINPVISVFRQSFFPDGNFSIDNIVKVLSSKSIQQTILNTLLMSILTVISVNIVGLFQIIVTEYFDIKGSAIAKYIFFVPLILTSISLVTGLQFLFNEYSVVNTLLANIFPWFNAGWFKGFWAVFYVHTFFYNTYFILFVRTQFKKVDYSTIEAAKSLGASNFRAFVQVALPVILPSILSSSVLTFITALASNAAPTILGGDFQMINSRITLLSSLGKRDMAAILALILGVISVAFMLLSNFIEKKGNYISASKVPTKIKKIKIKNPVANVIMHILTYLMCLLYAFPVIAVTIYSFTDADTILTKSLPTNFTFDNYIRVFGSGSTAIQPILNSFSIGGAATLAALFVGVFSAIIIFKAKSKPAKIGSKALELSLLIPWVVPASMMALGLIIAYDIGSPLTFGNSLIGTWWILPIGFAVISVPSIVRLTRASLFGVNRSLEESAASLGASPIRTFFVVVLPIIIPTVISAAAQAFNSKLVEYTMSSLLYAPRYTPLGIAFKAGTDGSDLKDMYANNLVYIVLVMALGAIVYAITTKLREKVD